MSQIRIAKAGDVEAFPGSTFVIDGTPPIAQCQEAQLVDGAVTWTPGLPEIGAIGQQNDHNLIGKKVTIAGSASDDGTYNILAHNPNDLTTDHTFVGADGGASATFHDAGQAYLTRNIPSFANFVNNRGKAYTIKGGQLFTDSPDPPMDAACSDTWNPE